MSKKLSFSVCSVLLLLITFTTQPLTKVKAEATIYIRPDGTIDQPTKESSFFNLLAHV